MQTASMNAYQRQILIIPYRMKFYVLSSTCSLGTYYVLGPVLGAKTVKINNIWSYSENIHTLS